MTESTRRRLPDTRPSIVHHFTIAGQDGYMIVGMYADGRPAELFLKLAKAGSTIRGFADAIGILTSIALQHGVAPGDLARKFTGSTFQPSGPTHNPAIPEASSIADYVFRWLDEAFPEQAKGANDGIGKETGGRRL